MKKFVTLVLAAALSASVLGCAGEKPPAPAPTKTEPAPEAPKTEPAPAEGTTPAPEEKK